MDEQQSLIGDYGFGVYEIRVLVRVSKFVGFHSRLLRSGEYDVDVEVPDEEGELPIVVWDHSGIEPMFFPTEAIIIVHIPSEAKPTMIPFPEGPPGHGLLNNAEQFVSVISNEKGKEKMLAEKNVLSQDIDKSQIKVYREVIREVQNDLYRSLRDIDKLNEDVENWRYRQVIPACRDLKVIDKSNEDIKNWRYRQVNFLYGYLKDIDKSNCVYRDLRDIDKTIRDLDILSQIQNRPKEGITEVFERFKKLINDLQLHDKYYEAEERKSLKENQGHVVDGSSALMVNESTMLEDEQEAQTPVTHVVEKKNK
ncbi:hypothetical protein AgCh_021076 [Apium graveolens]